MEIGGCESFDHLGLDSQRRHWDSDLLEFAEVYDLLYGTRLTSTECALPGRRLKEEPCEFWVHQRLQSDQADLASYVCTGKLHRHDGQLSWLADKRDQELTPSEQCALVLLRHFLGDRSQLGRENAPLS